MVMGNPGMGNPGIGMGNPGLGMGNPGTGIGNPGIGMGNSRIGSGYATIGTGMLGPGMLSPGMGTIGMGLGMNNPIGMRGPSSNQIIQVRNAVPLGSIVVTWSYITYEGVFVEFEKPICSMIENSYSRNMPFHELQINEKIFLFNFREPFSMTSRKGHGTEIEIIRNDGSSQPILEKSQAKWLWKDDDGKFKEYESRACLLIERSYQGKKNNVLISCKHGMAFKIILNQNHLYQLNKFTNTKREIKRKVN